MSDDAHAQTIARIQAECPGIPGFYMLVAPKRPMVGCYQPDLLRFVLRPKRLLDLIVEVEISDFCGKDIPGACILADNLVERTETVPAPMLAFVLPDEIKARDMGHVEERLNIALSRMRRIKIAEARRAAEFIAWIKGRNDDEFATLISEPPSSDDESQLSF